MLKCLLNFIQVIMKNDVMRQLLSFVTGAVVATKCACKVKPDVSRGSATGHINPHFTCKVKRKQGTPESTRTTAVKNRISVVFVVVVVFAVRLFEQQNTRQT